jgi:dienelactone hydrolase
MHATCGRARSLSLPSNSVTTTRCLLRRSHTRAVATLVAASFGLVVAAIPQVPAAGVSRQDGTGIATTKLTLVDTTRPTPATPGKRAQKRRELETTIRYPESAAGPLPLIVLAHGSNGTPEDLDELMDAWAGAGYVVAAPLFPRVNVDRRGNTIPSEVAQFPADLSFVISQVVQLGNSSASGPLQGRVDARAIGAGGISLGGMSVYGLISNTCCRDDRVGAAILMGAVRPDFPRGKYTRQRVPVLLVHGDADIGYHWSTSTYPHLAPPKWFITLRHGRHGPPFEDEPDEHDDLVNATTTAFWDRYLKGDLAAADRIVADVHGSGGLATLERDLGGSRGRAGSRLPVFGPNGVTG